MSVQIHGRFIGANLQTATLSRANLQRANLSEASLWGAVLSRVNPERVLGLTRGQFVIAAEVDEEVWAMLDEADDVGEVLWPLPPRSPSPIDCATAMLSREVRRIATRVAASGQPAWAEPWHVDERYDDDRDARFQVAPF